MSETLLIAVALAGVFLLLFFVIRTKLHAFVALLLVSILVGIAAGMPLHQVLVSIQLGMGGTLGYVAIIVGLGAMIGQMLEVTGGAKKIAKTLIKKFGEERSQLALGITGFLIAIPVFFDVAFIILVPIIYNLAKKTGRSLLYYGIPLLAGLAVTHSFIPPTPGPIAVSKLIGANLGWVILFGLIAGFPAMLIAGPLFGKYIAKKINVKVPEYMNVDTDESSDDKDLPSFGILAIIILVPLMLMLVGTLVSILVPIDNFFYSIFTFLGHPFVALLIATLLAFYYLGKRQGYSNNEVQYIANKALEPAGIIILVTGAGGVFKQVLVDSQVGILLGEMMAASPLPPLLLSYIIAVIIRVAQGSATVSMIATASLISPLIDNLSLEGPFLALIVIAIASGATILSHINDSGFWLVNRYFGLDVKETLLSWTIMQTIISLVGFSIVLLISIILFY